MEHVETVDLYTVNTNNEQLPHLHLMSTYQFPLTQRIGLEQVLNHLLQAPQIVREMKPMAWSYLSPPQDGTMFITWQAPRMGQALASDGYIWTDMEGTFRQQVRGYVRRHLKTCYNFTN